jgi:hypothetical protein
MLRFLQVILDRISGKANSDTQIHATTLLEQRPLDERKLDYVQLRDGKKARAAIFCEFHLISHNIVNHSSRQLLVINGCHYRSPNPSRNSSRVPGPETIFRTVPNSCRRFLNKSEL